MEQIVCAFLAISAVTSFLAAECGNLSALIAKPIFCGQECPRNPFISGQAEAQTDRRGFFYVDGNN